MRCRASNPLARRIRGWSPKTCLGRPARKTRRTEENFSRRVVDMHPTHACTIFETTNYRSGTKQPPHVKGTHDDTQLLGSFFLLYAAWVRSRAERPSVSYTKVVSNVAWNTQLLGSCHCCSVAFGSSRSGSSLNRLA